MDARKFHQLASKLASGTQAVEFRTAINRAYYAVYHVGVEILKGMGFQISEGPGGHGEVRNRLYNSNDDEVKKVASQLGTLYSQRLDADYRLYKTNVEKQKNAQAAVKQADKMIQILDICCSGPKRAQIIQAIQEWEQKVSGKT
jgi:uncharacterized protein (UPF0332 family)